MSVRGNAFVVLNGQVTLWYDKWAAEDLPRRLNAGPALFLDRLYGWSLDDAPMNDVWCEGAALIDIDRRRLRWFGGSSINRRPWGRRVVSALLPLVWRGWSVAFECEGQSGLVRDMVALGLPIALGPPDDNDSDLTAIDFEIVDDALRATHTVTVLGRGVVGLRLPRIRSGSPLHCTIASVLAQGETAIDKLSSAPTLASMPHEERLGGGALIDPASRQIRIWHETQAPDARAPIEQSLPGWDVGWLDGGYVAQLQATNEDPWPHCIDPGAAFVDLIGDFEEGDARPLGTRLVMNGFAPPRILARNIQFEELRPYVARAVKGERVWTRPRD